MVEELVEVESGKDDHNRPALLQALAACKVYGATLIIAKLDRLSRDAHFLLGLQKANIEFIAVDMPHANKLTVGIMALVDDQKAKNGYLSVAGLDCRSQSHAEGGMNERRQE